MNIKYQVGKDDELKCSKEEQENNKENEVLEEEKGKKEQAKLEEIKELGNTNMNCCLLYTSPSPRDAHESRMPSSA